MIDVYWCIYYVVGLVEGEVVKVTATDKNRKGGC